MNNNWYITKMLATAHTNDLLAAADRHRLARQAQTRRWSLTRQVRVESEPAAARLTVATPATPAARATTEPAAARRPLATVATTATRAASPMRGPNA